MATSIKRQAKYIRGLNSTTAFTIIELLVVIAIISLLLAILMPSLGKARRAAMRLRCAYNLRQINMAMNMYVDENGNVFPCAQDPVAPKIWLWMGRGWRGFIEPFLAVNIDANHPSVLFCPQDKVAPREYESTSYSYSLAFYHSPEQINQMKSVADTYMNPQQSIPQKHSNVSVPSDKIIIGEWLSNHQPTEGKDGGWWCWEGKRNYLFVDGQVGFIEAQKIRKANDDFPDANLTIDGIRGWDWPAKYVRITYND
jgi:prepilin-type N-terminal cleavage/methylation domain-containing protein/prepilin-type processing-associated H-X9-DG protein